jgi:hypothetical protein
MDGGRGGRETKGRMSSHHLRALENETDVFNALLRICAILRKPDTQRTEGRTDRVEEWNSAVLVVLFFPFCLRADIRKLCVSISHDAGKKGILPSYHLTVFPSGFSLVSCLVKTVTVHSFIHSFIHSADRILRAAMFSCLCV